VKYFIDTNVIIDLLGQNKKIDSKRESQEEEQQRKREAQVKAKKQLEKILLEEDNKIFINRLVLVETLRTIHFTYKKKFRDAEATLESFEKLDIKDDIYMEAVEFSRFCNTKLHFTLKGKCEAIDFLHFVTAKYYNLTMVSNDRDMPKLEDAYVKFLESLNV
jgi:predicted nucleic acid-binding protein